MGVRERERVKFKSMRDQSLEFSHIFFIFNPITRIDFLECPKELFHDCRYQERRFFARYISRACPEGCILAKCQRSRYLR